MGGIRGLWHTRVPFEGCGALVFPDMFALPHANEAFDEAGRLRDPALAERLQREVVGFVRLAEAVIPVCTRTAAPPARKRQEGIVKALEGETELQPPAPAIGRRQSLADGVARPRHDGQALVRDRIPGPLADAVVAGRELPERPLDLRQQIALAGVDVERSAPLRLALRRLLGLGVLVGLRSIRRGRPEEPEDPGALSLQPAAQLVQLDLRQRARHRPRLPRRRSRRVLAYPAPSGRARHGGVSPAGGETVRARASAAWARRPRPGTLVRAGARRPACRSSSRSTAARPWRTSRRSGRSRRRSPRRAAPGRTCAWWCPPWATRPTSCSPSRRRSRPPRRGASSTCSSPRASASRWRSCRWR